jgi:hypothetical protein
MGDLDIAAKALLREDPAPLVRLALGGRAIVSIEADETELQAIERRMDKLFRVTVADGSEPVWLHFEVEAQWGADVPRRTFRYWSLAHQTRPALRSAVLVLRPGDKQGEPRGAYEVTVLGERVLSFGFVVLRAWDLDPSEILSLHEPSRSSRSRRVRRFDTSTRPSRPSRSFRDSEASTSRSSWRSSPRGSSPRPVGWTE